MIKLNCLAKNLQNAKDIHKATNGNTFIGMLSKDYDSVKAAVVEINAWSKELDKNISIGLGNGDPNQCYMVSDLVEKVDVIHANQVFTEVPATRRNAKNKNIIINSLVSPAGEPGKVIISTGPQSSQATIPIIGDINTVALMIREMGGNSIKFFSMKNMKTEKELKKIAEACVKHDLILELTGGIGLENIEKYLKICKENHVSKMIVHVYGSIIDQDTGFTNINKVKQIWTKLERY